MSQVSNPSSHQISHHSQLPQSNIETLCQLPSEILQHHSGPKSGELKEVTTPETCTPDSLVFVSQENQFFDCLKAGAKCLVVSKKIAKVLEGPELSSEMKSDKTFFITPAIPMALSYILPFFDRKQLLSKECQIHSSAVIHPTARVGAGTRLGAYCVIEEGVEIGANCILGPHTYIGPNAKIGNESKIHASVIVECYCEVGSRCEIMSGTVIGSDGFGFATPPSGEHRKIPQIGKVIIEDDVEIGANCTIDRAAITVTRLRRGLKMDNLCHVAHNVEMGEWNLITAGFITAGSTKTGRHVYTGGGVHLTDHIEIADQVTLMGRTGVTNDIKQSGVYGGFPAIPYRDSIKVLASAQSLPKMRKQIQKLYKFLNLNSDED